MRRTRTHGFSLVVSLIILTLLAILVVSFISTTALERTTARAYASKTVAEAAAQTAINQATSLVAEKIAQYPDSATVWEPLTPKDGGARSFEGTVLYMNERPNDANSRRFVLPLVSRPDADGKLLEEVEIASKADALGTGKWEHDTSIDLNRPRFNGDTAGWIGSPPSKGATPTTPRPFSARWVEVKGQPSGDKPARTIARYAFWIEDESFKVNLNLLGDAERKREIDSPGAKPAEVPLQGVLRNAGVAVSERDPIVAQKKRLRESWFGKQLFELRAFNQRFDDADLDYALGDRAKFLATIHSAAPNLSRHGTQRVNLNSVIELQAPGFDWKTYDPDDAKIEKQTKQIVETIRFHAPKFGEHFYRNPAGSDRNAEQVPPLHREIFLYKLAANIRDFIDPDLQPTLITDQARVAPRARPVSAINANAPNEIWAQGKDSGPYLQEAVVRYRTSVSGGRYNLRVDYYLEFWNMGTKDIYAAQQPDIAEPHALGSNAFVRVSNQQAWLSHPSGGQLKEDNSPQDDPAQHPRRDMVIDLNTGIFNAGRAVPTGVVFRTGACTVITTDPDYNTVPASGSTSPAFSGGYNRANIYYCSQILAGKREYNGPAGSGGIRPDFRDGGEDYDTEIILGNDRGIIDSHPAAIAMGGGAKTTSSGSPRDDWYGGTLLGNATTPSQVGDPRTNNEMLNYVRFMSGASVNEPDQARYFNTVGSPRFSLGHPNDLYVNPQNPNAWPDHYKGWTKTSTNTATNPNADNAPAFTYNGRLTPAGAFEPQLASIGLLGGVFDPARVKGTRGSLGIEGARGGGRSLRIGQRDDLVDMSRVFTPSQQWAAWRLADFFGTSSEPTLPGLININGLPRDNGAAFRAACYGMILRSVSQAANASLPSVSDKTLGSEEDTTTPGVQRLIEQAIVRLQQAEPKPGYFRERGEISELDIFSAATDDLIAGVRMNVAFDRTREELSRRLFDLITTRGNVFTVYAVGQAITEGRDAARTLHVTGEHWVKTTFALLPRNADGSAFHFPAETFDPADAASRTRRFAKPDHYDIQLLQVAAP